MAVRSCAVQVTRFAACRSTGPSLRNKAASNRQIRSSHISPRPPASINFHRAPIQVARPRVSSSPRPAYQARGTVTTMSASSVAEFIGTQTPIIHAIFQHVPVPEEHAGYHAMGHQRVEALSLCYFAEGSYCRTISIL